MMGFGFGGLGWITMLIFWVAVIALALWVLGKLFPRVTDTPSSQPRPQRNKPPSESPLEILEQRYARGEISKTEYEAMQRDLAGS